MLWLDSDEGKSELCILDELGPVAALCLGYPEAIPDVPPKERP
jgi:hypothetical protein